MGYSNRTYQKSKTASLVYIFLDFCPLQCLDSINKDTFKCFHGIQLLHNNLKYFITLELSVSICCSFFSQRTDLIVVHGDTNSFIFPVPSKINKSTNLIPIASTQKFFLIYLENNSMVEYSTFKCS